MRNSFTVYDVEQQEFVGKKGIVKQQVYILQDASVGPKLKQFCEFNASEGAPQMNPGDRVDLEIGEIQSIFSGRPRLRGKIAGVVNAPTPAAASTPKRP